MMAEFYRENQAGEREMFIQDWPGLTVFMTQFNLRAD